MKPRRVMVVCGGTSLERDVSLKTGRAVFKALSGVYDNVSCFECGDPVSCLEAIVNESPDVVFIALHGGYGEDGHLQAALEMHGIRYTGSDSRVSAICMDKFATKSILSYSGLPVERGVLVREVGDVESVDVFPACVKPNNEGSSIGVEFVNDMDELREKAEKMLKEFSPLIVERRLFGAELTVGVVAGRVLPVIHIKPREGFYDYKHKYTVGATEYIVPADIDDRVQKKCEEIGLEAYRIMGCRGFARIDMMLEGDVPYILEVNTIPGMTVTSLLPKAAMAAGWSFRDMLVAIIESDE